MRVDLGDIQGLGNDHSAGLDQKSGLKMLEEDLCSYS